jgi:succinate-semialdehyde dehydrogenase/glutarate-semialdehyde dehydrogenase
VGGVLIPHGKYNIIQSSHGDQLGASSTADQEKSFDTAHSIIALLVVINNMASKTLADLKNKDLLRTKGYIDHAWVDATSGATFDVINPATLEKLATLPEMDAKDVDRAVEAAAVAFQSYKKTSARQRARWLRKWSDLCHDNVDDLALIMTLENGKTLTEAKGEVVYAASFLEWFAGEAERVHGEVVPTANLGQRIVTIKQPLGVAACLTPWNFPLASMSAIAYAIQCII